MFIRVYLCLSVVLKSTLQRNALLGKLSKLPVRDAKETYEKDFMERRNRIDVSRMRERAPSRTKR